jgi:hypothetical protein
MPSPPPAFVVSDYASPRSTRNGQNAWTAFENHPLKPIMSTRLPNYWRNLKAYRPPEVVATVIGGIVIGVLGNAMYDCIKEIGKEGDPSAQIALAAASKPAPRSQEGYVIDVHGKPAMLITESAVLDTARAFALQAAFGTKGLPPYEVVPGQNVIRIYQVYVVNLNENTSFSSPGCWNTYLVRVDAEQAGPDLGRGAVSGKSTRCTDKVDKALPDFIDQDMIAEAVEKLLAAAGPQAASRDVGTLAGAQPPNGVKPGKGIGVCLPCWLWNRSCKDAR